MKTIKNVLATMAVIISAQAAVGMEAPQEPIQVQQAKPLIPVKIFPPDIQRKLFPQCMKGNLYEIAETILAIAGTSKEQQNYVNDNMIAILESFSYTAKAIEIYKLLQSKTTSLPVMQKPHMKIWLKAAQRSLYGEQELYRVMGKVPDSIEEIKEFLQKMDVNRIPPFFETCLGTAALNKDQGRATLLLGIGANPNISDSRGNTPLLFAVRHENKAMALLLLEAGANPSLKNKQRNNKTIRTLAFEEGIHEMIPFLDEAIAARKQRWQERKKRIYGQKIESTSSNTADGCTIS